MAHTYHSLRKTTILALELSALLLLTISVFSGCATTEKHKASIITLDLPVGLPEDEAIKRVKSIGFNEEEKDPFSCEIIDSYFSESFITEPNTINQNNTTIVTNVSVPEGGELLLGDMATRKYISMYYISRPYVDCGILLEFEYNDKGQEVLSKYTISKDYHMAFFSDREHIFDVENHIFPDDVAKILPWLWLENFMKSGSVFEPMRI